jgi:hypothetical protein
MLPDGKMYQFGVDSIAQAISVANRESGYGRNIFVGVGALKKALVWSAKEQRFKVSRAGDNIRGLRAYTMDIDVGVRKNGKGHDSTKSALEQLIAFCKHAMLPKPTLVQSGNGLHVWWTLTDEVPEATWEHYGKILSGKAKAFGLRHDSGRSIDSSSILRVVGYPNHKYPDKPLVALLAQGKPTSPEAFHALLGGETPTAATPTAVLEGPAPDADFGSNTSRYEADALSMKKLVENCAAIRRVCTPEIAALGREGVPEPAWQQVVMAAVHCKDGRQRAHDISKLDPRYNAEYVDRKFDRLKEGGYGPATCVRLHKAWEEFDGSNACTGCPQFDATKAPPANPSDKDARFRITSPAQLSRIIKELPPLVAKEVVLETGEVIERPIVAPPDDYVRTPRGIGLKFQNPKTQVDDVVYFCPYDMYPVRMAYDEKKLTGDAAVWMVNLPKDGWTRIGIPYCATSKTLALELQRRRIHIDPTNADLMAKFMSLYLKKLQDEAKCEMEYAKMGWREEGFVVGDTLYREDSKVEIHAMSDSLAESTGNSMDVKGSLAEWVAAAQTYNRKDCQALRINIATAFSAPLYGLTDHGSTCFNASGEGGVGKTTVMRLSAAIWGRPQGYMLRNFTPVAMETAAGAYNNLPMMIDEITIHNAKAVADFVFQFSGGKGKIRGAPGGGLRGDTATWATILMTNANSDVYMQMSAAVGDANPHLMRLIQIEFPRGTAISKKEGDAVTRVAFTNYGHAGRVYGAYIAQHREELRERIKSREDEIALAVGERSGERFWYAWAACVWVAYEIAVMLGLLPNFPVKDDMAWVMTQIRFLRTATTAYTATPTEMIARFIDEHASNALVINAKGSGNIDNVVALPHGPLMMRKELDNDVIYIARSALNDYCSKNNIHIDRAVLSMQKSGVCCDPYIKRSLGAGTNLKGGPVVCVALVLSRLEAEAPLENEP